MVFVDFDSNCQNFYCKNINIGHIFSDFIKRYVKYQYLLFINIQRKNSCHTFTLLIHTVLLHYTDDHSNILWSTDTHFGHLN